VFSDDRALFTQYLTTYGPIKNVDWFPLQDTTIAFSMQSSINVYNAVSMDEMQDVATKYGNNKHLICTPNQPELCCVTDDSLQI
jgi:hypothetical protein